MARHLPPFGTLKLTREEEFAVRQQASEVIQRALALEIEYRRQGAQVDVEEWKKVSRVDDFHVFKQRRRARRRSDPPARQDTTSSEDIGIPELFSVREDSGKQWRESVSNESEISLSRSPSSGSSGDELRVPEMMCTGNLEGRLEDFMYGVYDGEDESWRLRAAYTKDTLEDARILATLERPTQDDPFRFLGIKWFSMEYPPVVGAFIQKRETLVAHSTGMTMDDQGDPYGYYMMDNFVHSSLPERSESGRVRNKFRLCLIYRQLTMDRIGVFARSYVDAGGSLSPSLTITRAALSLSSITNGVETAHSKKLAWLMERERGRRRSTATADQSSVCQSCHKGALGLLSRSMTDSHVCGQLFCGKCIVERKLIVDMDASQLTPRALPFCLACVLRAKQLSSVDLMLTSDSKEQ
ncbi:hypothetical protein Poli38472_012586 [Pythium oligandrum]|uniref:Uncharacterized protein n=1 Tax=Pythium oligandrum TaxID=41045 RepID=A0A8K1FF93_PYTOL|nr:hypothetical protein Poli38472_012586 [Pythium oligandrum]|eukprot:TMW61395.1 hypothetical protein Poli38472_012586 [Pythium oligandrum]